MTGHQSKRPYAGSIHQPQITTFFSAQPSTTPSFTPSDEPRTPPLPHHIQSNLLSVGMRVRKSVPEGYKTGSYSAFTLFSDTSPPSSPEENVGVNSGGNRVAGVKTRPRARELTPFCGILKVGGMAQQQWGIYNPNRGEEMDDDGEMEDECPVLSQGSDGSVESAFGGYAGGNKRRFEEEEEDVEVDRSVRLGMGFGSGFGGGRVMAVPRRKKMSIGGGDGKIGIFGQGQENVRVQVEGDFEEAEFLDYGSMGEVEMGGV